ncbi:MAG: aminomethyltransferase family protein, partial [Geminicoccaceae bacterium]
GETAFRLVSGAATRWKDLARLKRHRDRLAPDTSVADVTSAEAVIGVMGPMSRGLLQSLTSADLSSNAFPFATSTRIDVGMAEVRATRMSFVGELGFELSIPAEFAEAVYENLIEAGAAFGLAHAGHLALNACRLEKGYCHWGHDIGPDDTPLEAGLSFAVAWEKCSGFIGREALLAERERGLARRLMMFAVEGAGPLLIHDEPIYRDGVLVGSTTSGGRGFRVNETLCMAYIGCARGTPKRDMLEGRYQISVAGERFTLRPLARPPYDPDAIRLRG